MRTTLTLDDDVAAQLERLAHAHRKPFKVVVNETIRKGLGTAKIPATKPFRVKPLALGLQPGIDERRFNQLVDELEAEAAFEKHHKPDDPARR